MTDDRLLHHALLAGVLLIGGLGAPADLAAQTRETRIVTTVRPQDAAEGVHIRFVGKGKNAESQRFVVTGLPATDLQRLAAAAEKDTTAWFETMVVTVVSDGAAKARPMLGDYSIDDTALVFVPRFPLRQGTTYRVEVLANADRRKPLSRDFDLPARGTHTPTHLLAVYPTTNVLPENQLKFYLHFSSAMSRGEAYRRIKLIDQNGKQVDFPFLELGEELWDPGGIRFTLFFDPGRIKRGLKPRELFGPALEEGKSYTLVVDQAWKDADGHPLKATYSKRFKVVAPDDTQPKPAEWQIVEPAADSRRPLVVSFGEPLDHAMLQRVLTVTRDRNAVAGRIVISKHESQWSFQPDDPWTAGQYTLTVDAALEDLAGNSISRPFEVDVFEKVDRKPPQVKTRIPFQIRP